VLILTVAARELSHTLAQQHFSKESHYSFPNATLTFVSVCVVFSVTDS
jgi:hypothetical protein